MVQLNDPVPVHPIYNFFEHNNRNEWMIEYNGTGAKIYIQDDELMVIFKLRFPQ